MIEKHNEYGRNVMSFKVPINLNGRRDMFKIISKAFVTTIMKCNSLDQAYSYRVEGTYLEGKNMLVFDLNKARKL